MRPEQPIRDVEWMLRAIALGMQARRISPPNPWVGCVLVRDDQVVGEGHTQPAGGPHAEVIALQAAGTNSRDATAYVSLEPCCHHGRTPPCTQAIIRAGISRVVIGVQDPDPRVRGRGTEELRSAGIDVVVGVCEDVASKALQPYIHQRVTKRPWCIVKAALSIDGRVAAKDGSSQWISDEEARVDVHELRADSQAILIGSGTALRDRPSLTVRHGVNPGVRQPLRVLLDASGRVPAEGPLFDPTLAKTLVFTSTDKRADEWKAAGAEVVKVAPNNLEAVLDDLGARGIIQLLVEGGARVQSRLLMDNLANQLTVYYGPLLLGNEGLPFFQGGGPNTIQEAARYRLLSTKLFGSTVRSDYAL